MHPTQEQEVAREELVKQIELVGEAWQAVLDSVEYTNWTNDDTARQAISSTPEYTNWKEQCKRLTDAQERDEQAELKAWFSSNRAKWTER